MSKARLRRVGACTVAITVAGPLLKPHFIPICQKGVAALLDWLKKNFCTFGQLPDNVKKNCPKVVTWVEGQWKVHGAAGCGAMWDALMAFLQTLC